MKMDFKQALESDLIRNIRRIPKSDLHDHALLGARRSVLGKMLGIRFGGFSAKTGTIGDVNGWIAEQFRPVFDHPGAFGKAVEAAFHQARSDGITLLEMSMDVMFGRLFKVPPEKVIATLKQAHGKIAPHIEFRPELGMSRSLPVRTLFSCIEPFLDSGFFRSVDLYDDEFAQPVENFRELYRHFRRCGLKLKAHAGEFGDAASVRHAAEVLELDAIQHGIAAAASPEVMKWIADAKIQLNICPESNIRLKRVASYSAHPIRILFDHGVKVTVNSDDVLLFNTGVSEQFLKLYRCGLFSAGELEVIRQNGLS